MVGEEGAAILADKVLDGLPPPAGMPIAATLQHQGPAGGREGVVTGGGMKDSPFKDLLPFITMVILTNTKINRFSGLCLE